LPSNLPLFAKAETIVIRRAAFDGLSADDRKAILAAATTTVAHANPAALERSEVAALCGQGLRLVRVGAPEIVARRRAAGPAYAALERDPTTRREIVAIQRLAADRPGVVPLRPCHRAKPLVASGTSRFPQATYEETVTKADFGRQHVTPNPQA